MHILRTSLALLLVLAAVLQLTAAKHVPEVEGRQYKLFSKRQGSVGRNENVKPQGRFTSAMLQQLAALKGPTAAPTTESSVVVYEEPETYTADVEILPDSDYSSDHYPSDSDYDSDYDDSDDDDCYDCYDSDDDDDDDYDSNSATYSFIPSASYGGGPSYSGESNQGGYSEGEGAMGLRSRTKKVNRYNDDEEDDDENSLEDDDSQNDVESSERGVESIDNAEDNADDDNEIGRAARAQPSQWRRQQMRMRAMRSRNQMLRRQQQKARRRRQQRQRSKNKQLRQRQISKRRAAKRRQRNKQRRLRRQEQRRNKAQQQRRRRQLLRYRRMQQRRKNRRTATINNIRLSSMRRGGNNRVVRVVA